MEKSEEDRVEKWHNTSKKLVRYQLLNANMNKSLPVVEGLEFKTGPFTPEEYVAAKKRFTDGKAARFRLNHSRAIKIL